MTPLWGCTTPQHPTTQNHRLSGFSRDPKGNAKPSRAMRLFSTSLLHTFSQPSTISLIHTINRWLMSLCQHTSFSTTEKGIDWKEHTVTIQTHWHVADWVAPTLTEEKVTPLRSIWPVMGTKAFHQRPATPCQPACLADLAEVNSENPTVIRFLNPSGFKGKTSGTFRRQLMWVWSRKTSRRFDRLEVWRKFNSLATSHW